MRRSVPLAIWSYFGPVQSDSLQRGKAMFQGHVNLRKAILGCSASVLALATAMPASAQETSTSDQKPQPNVPAEQAQGQAPAGQVRTGTNGDQTIIITGIRASIQASLDSKRRNDMVSEVVTAQDIGKFPDKNVADSLEIGRASCRERV